MTDGGAAISLQARLGVPWRPATSRAPGQWDALIALVLFGFTLWRLLPAAETTPFHRDEARWVHRVYLLHEWADPFGPRWQDEGYPEGGRSWDERYRMRDQPPLAPYVFALGLLAQGRDLQTNGFWDMDRDDAWNVAAGNLPSPGDLAAARRTNVAVAALIVVAAYLLGRRLAGRVAGVAGALLLALHPLLLYTATRAWTDPTMALCVALAAVAAYRLADRPSWPRALVLGALLGLGGRPSSARWSSPSRSAASGWCCWGGRGGGDEEPTATATVWPGGSSRSR